MLKWLIAGYILIVLVFSAKAHAHISVESNPALNKINNPTRVFEKLNVQDPLPEVIFEDTGRIYFDQFFKNSVG